MQEATVEPSRDGGLAAFERGHGLTRAAESGGDLVERQPLLIRPRRTCTPSAVKTAWVGREYVRVTFTMITPDR